LIPFVYLFAGQFKLRIRRGLALIGLATTLFGIAFVFVPSSGIQNIIDFELTLIGGTVFMLGTACILYWRALRVRKYETT
jgi:hypothetical protein